MVSQSEAVLVAARREEGGGLLPRLPCDSFFGGLMPRRPRDSFFFCLLTPQDTLVPFFVDVYGVRATRFVFVDILF